MASRTVRLIGLLLLVAGPVRADEEDTAAIRPTDLRRHVAFLSADALGGRQTGAPGVQRAEAYIAERFARLGLEPLPGRDDRYVPFRLYARDYEPSATTLELDLGGHRLAGAAGIDFRPLEFSDDGLLAAQVVFAGYGITAPEHDHDDYAGLDVRGKIVLALRHEPDETDPTSSFDGTATTRHAMFAVKAERARNNGAVGMMLVTDPLHHPAVDDLRLGGSLRLDPPPVLQATASADSAASQFLAVHVSRRIADALLGPARLDLGELQRAVDRGIRPAAFDLTEVRATIRVTRERKAREVGARNVAGLLAGRDPRLRNEWIVVGAHHDHVGAFVGEGDTVYNGADDNASGTAAVLELAAAFARNERRPRRSILFTTFSGEEHGLLGSRAMVEQRLIPLDKVVFMLNLDMIGRNADRPLEVYGDGFGVGLSELVARANAGVGLVIELAGSLYAGNSDHHPFYEEQIPFLFFFTGVHEDYHQPGDHAEKLDYDRMTRIVGVAHDLLWRIAEADYPPSFVHHVPWLGLRLTTSDTPNGRVARILGVEPGSRAERAGLHVGDAVRGIDAAVPEAAEKIAERFRDVEPGSRSTLHVARGGRRLAIEVVRARRGFLGVSPAQPEEEARRRHGLRPGEGVLLRRVVPGGPAARAGLRAGDILVRIADRAVGGGSLSGLLAQIGAGETVDLLVLRDGERRVVTLTLGERPADAG